MFIATSWCLLALVMTSRAERWRWPEGAQSVRIDTKVRFVDTSNDKNRDKNIQSDEPSFEQPSDTDGFYNRPSGAGRYPVRVEPHLEPYRVDSSSFYPINNQGRRQYHDSDGTLDSLQHCKCVSTDECDPRADSHRACGSGKSLCCYKRSNKVYSPNSEVFNELEDERPMLFPGQVNSEGAFSHPGDVGGYGHFGPNRQEVLVGPGGPTGQVGPAHAHQLITRDGPDDRIGPNGNIGPKGPIYQHKNPAVLVGPDGPTGVIGPASANINPRPDVGQSESAQRGVLVGPGGPTGFIGPYSQRPVLTGPSGPTGIIGPRGGRRGVLSGPGGPTGIIGPGYERQSGPGVLIGPGGPTGVIGPGRQLLVGPGGPTGIIGPRYFESAPVKTKPKPQCKRNERNPQKNPLSKDVDHEVLDEHTNPNTRVHHLGPPRIKRSYKITRVVDVRTVNSKRKPLVTRDVRVVPLRSKRELLSSVNGTNEAVPRFIRELLRSVSKMNEMVPQSKRELFSTGRGKNDLATWSKRKWFCTGVGFNEGATQSKREILSPGRGKIEAVLLSNGEPVNLGNGQRTIDEALRSIREQFSTGLGRNGALRSKREMLRIGRGTKKRKLQPKRSQLRRVNMTNEGAQKSKRDLCTRGCTNVINALPSFAARSRVKSTRRGRVRRTLNKRTPRREKKQRLRYRKQGSEDYFDETTEVPIRTTTRKKIGDKERIPVFMFVIKMLDFDMRIVS